MFNNVGDTGDLKQRIRPKRRDRNLKSGKEKKKKSARKFWVDSNSLKGKVRSSFLNLNSASVFLRMTLIKLPVTLRALLHQLVVLRCCED